MKQRCRKKENNDKNENAKNIRIWSHKKNNCAKSISSKIKLQNIKGFVNQIVGKKL